MKLLTISIAALSALSLSLVAYAQTAQPDATTTRAQVRSELQQLEQAGYSPAKGDDASYPTDIQAAEARLSTQTDATAYGGVMPGASASGTRSISQPASTDEMKHLYFGQ